MSLAIDRGRWLDLDDPASVERLADALAQAPIANILGDEERLRISLLRQASVVIAALRGVNGLPSTPDETADPA